MNYTKGIFSHFRNRDVLEFTGIVELENNNYRRLDFGYKQSDKGTASKVYFFLDNNYHLSQSDKKFFLHPERNISEKEFEHQLDHAAQLFFKELGVNE